MEEDGSIEEKQEYLRVNILEKGFKADEFADYLVSKKGEGAADVNALTMDDLHQAVKEFIEGHKSDNKEEQKDKISNDDEEEKENKNKKNEEEEGENEIKINEEKNEEKINEKEDEKEKKEEKESSKKAKKEEKEPPKKDINKEPKKEEKKVIKDIPKKFQNIVEIEGDIPPEIYGIVTPQFFECKQLENTPLSSTKNPVITISSPEKKEGSFFIKSYISYLVTTSEINLNVKRRYSDFVWLHQALLDLYPYLFIPPIPKKKIGTDNFSDVFITKRMRYLEKFMNWILDNPVLKNSQLIYDFISIENDDELSKKKIEYQKMDTPMNLVEFHVNGGKMSLSVNKEKEGCFQKILDNNSNTENLLNNLNSNLKHLKYFFDMFILKLGEVQKNWEILLANSTKNFEDINISNTYEKMGKLFANWGESLKKQNDLVFIELREYFKYVKNNFRDMRSNINYVDSVRNEYYRTARYLMNKKEDLFRSKDVQRWEMDPNEKTNVNSLLDNKLSALFKMCVKDTDRAVQRRTYYGYYLNQFIEEYERVRKLNGRLYKKNLNNFCKKLNDIITEFHKQVAESMLVDENENKIEENI